MEDKLYHQLGFYKSLPSGIRNVLGYAYRAIPLSVRYGKTYTYYNRLLQSSPYWEDQKKHDFVIKRLKDTLINAYENTAFYKQQFDKVKFDPHTFESLEQLERIPLIDKLDLRNHKQDIKNQSIPGNQFLYVTTGGTTGVPVELYYLKGRERAREYAFMTEQWKRVGFRKGDKVAVIRGTVVDDKHDNTYFKYDPIKYRLFLSLYDLSDENIKIYIDKLLEFKPKYIHAYPSSASILAKYVKNNSIHFPGLKAIFCSSEQFYPGQRELIENAFKTKVYSWYGHSEYTTLAGECEVNSDYHLFFEYGYTELIDENGKVITQAGVQGEIVGTSFEMKGFPIIRYKTGDFAEWVKGTCACGRNYQLINKIVGRRQIEQLVTKRNSLISMTAINMHSDLFDNVIQFQFVQDKIGEVVLNLIKGENYSESDELKILKQLNRKLKTHVDLKINYVDKFSFSSRGKYKFLDQKLNIDFSFQT